MHSCRTLFQSIPKEVPKKVVVVGMGNPLLTDDTIGLLVADAVERELGDRASSVSFGRSYCGGFDLLYQFAGFDCALMVDRVDTGAVPGTTGIYGLSELPGLSQPRLTDAHGLDLNAVLATGRKCGYSMPAEVVLVGVEGQNFEAFAEEPSPEVAAAKSKAIKMVIDQLVCWVPQTSREVADG